MMLAADEVAALSKALAIIATSDRTRDQRVARDYARQLEQHLTTAVACLDEGHVDPSAQQRAADELERLVGTLAAIAKWGKVEAAKAPADVRAHLAKVDLGVVGAFLTYVAQWLRAPTPEGKALIEDAMTKLGGTPGAKSLWDDPAATKKFHDDLDAEIASAVAEIFGKK